METNKIRNPEVVIQSVEDAKRYITSGNRKPVVFLKGDERFGKPRAAALEIRNGLWVLDFIQKEGYEYKLLSDFAQDLLIAGRALSYEEATFLENKRVILLDFWGELSVQICRATWSPTGKWGDTLNQPGFVLKMRGRKEQETRSPASYGKTYLFMEIIK